jgi:hypothetical protein
VSASQSGKDRAGDDGGHDGRDTRPAGGPRGGPSQAPLALVEGVVDSAQQGKLGPAAHSAKVVGIDGPGHYARQLVVVGKLRLLSDGLLIVVADPPLLLEHVGRLVVLIPHARPGVVLLAGGSEDAVTMLYKSKFRQATNYSRRMIARLTSQMS